MSPPYSLVLLMKGVGMALPLLLFWHVPLAKEGMKEISQGANPVEASRGVILNVDPVTAAFKKTV